MEVKTWLDRIARGAAVSLLFSTGTAWAANADLSDLPLTSMTDGTAVRANLMFVLDNSGSMNWNFLPDDAPQTNVCFGSADRNLIFFNPSSSYPPPVNANGTSKPNASFVGAWDDGYNTGSSSTVDLSDNNPETPAIYGALVSGPTQTVRTEICGARNSPSCSVPSPNPSSSERFDGTNTVITEVTVERVNASSNVTCRNNTANSCALKTTTVSTSYRGEAGRFLWATRNTGASSSSCTVADFNVVRVTSSTLTTELRQKYANWFSYYRTRMLAMRAAAGLAFSKIDASRFRVGFSRISDYANGGADATGFLNIRDYDGGTQKVDFYSKLYSTEGTSNTPLRPALARAGRYYANKLTGQTDPVQYSCQRNYTILSTDGYWNQESALPKNLSGGDGVGNPDAGSGVDRPMRDEFNRGQGVSNSLADVAQYYYVNDLRTSALGNCTGAVANQDVCENNVPDTKKDPNRAQHMTTFTLGLGLSGTLAYDAGYEADSYRGDFYDIRQGTKVWPDPIGNADAERIDDLWHAAVNGRGTYYSAKNPADIALSLSQALKDISSKPGSGSAAATSALIPSLGDDWVFLPTYKPTEWWGDVDAYKINTGTGEILNFGTPIWSAADRIKGQATRNIYFNKNGNRTNFTLQELTDAGYLASFSNLCGKLSQCSALSDASKTKLTAENLISFLRGSSAYEQTASAPDDRLFRIRTKVLGDIVNASPVYVRKPPMSYGDGYATFVANASTRQGVLYVAANDGMLHALKVETDSEGAGGTELWAFVPTKVMPDMYRLADLNYDTNHRFYVDASPVVADVQNPKAGYGWSTILVGGLGKGGQGYYALDVTDPMNPKVLWEFSDGGGMGYTYGNPVVVKNKAGRWVVAFTSGYNNSNRDGHGFLYVVDALTGAQISKIEAKAQSDASAAAAFTGANGTPSNLGKINAWVDDPKTNVASRIYAGDTLGNVWRFDFDNNYGDSGNEAILLGSTGASQPITTRPVLSEIVSGADRYPVVSVATGRYLGLSDVGDKSLQSIYTFRDSLNNVSLGLLRSNAGMVKQTLSLDRKGLNNPANVDWARNTGWYVDLSLSAGERVNVDFEQQLNQLIVASNIPTPTVCSPGGTAWLYYLDVGTGKPLLSYASDTMIVGFKSIGSTTDKLITLEQRADSKNVARKGSDINDLPPGQPRRTSWRELMN